MKETIIDKFKIGFGGRRERIWGNVDGVPVTTGTWPRTFFKEFLPAVFKRELRFEKSEPNGGCIRWLLWGKEGGVTIEVNKNKVSAWVRYYDSTAFTDFSARDVHRFPEQIVRKEECLLKQALSSLSVQVDYHHKLTIRGNDQIVLEFVDFPQDLQRHQLGLSNDEQGGICGELIGPAPVRVPVEVYPDKKHQEMLGFGGTTTPTGYVELSAAGRMEFWRTINEYNLLIHRDYPMGEALKDDLSNQENLAEAKPSYYANNPPNSEISNWGIVRNARELGGLLVFEFWDLPPWVMQDWDGKEFKKVAHPEKYAEMMVACARCIEQKTGQPPEIVGVQNELRQPPEIWKAMTLALRKKLDEAGYSQVKIHMPNLNRMFNTVKALPYFVDDKEVWDTIDYSSTNIYDFQDHFDNPDAYDYRLNEWHERTATRPFLCIELCLNEPRYQWASFRAAFTMGQMYHKVLTICDAIALGYCWTILNVTEPSFGWTRSLMMTDFENNSMPMDSSHQLRVFGAFSRRIKAGMRRIALSNDNPDLMVSAYSDDNGACTLVALNRSIHPSELQLDWPGANFDTLETASVYSRNQAQPIKLTESQNTITVAPGSIITLTNVPLNTMPDNFIPCVVE